MATTKKKEQQISQTEQSGFSASVQDRINRVRGNLYQPTTTKVDSPRQSYYELPEQDTLNREDVDFGRKAYEEAKRAYQESYSGSKEQLNKMFVDPISSGAATLTDKLLSNMPDAVKWSTPLTAVAAGVSKVIKRPESQYKMDEWEGVSDRLTKNMDEKTLQEFYAQYGKDPDAAVKSARAYNTAQAQAEAAKTQEEFRQNLDNSNVPEWLQDTALTVGNLALDFVKPIDTIRLLGDYALGGGNFSEKAKAGVASPIASAQQMMRNEVAQDIQGATEGTWMDLSNPSSGLGKAANFMFGDNLGTFLYNMGYSTIQSRAITGTLGGYGTILMGSNAATDKVLEELQRGNSSENAIALGVINGLAEWATERFITLEYALKPVRATKEWALNILRSALAEGSEEVFSGIIDMTADIVINQEDNEIARKKAEYLAAGANDKQAFQYVLRDVLSDTFQEFLSGALSGAVMSGTSTAANEINTNASYRQEYQNAVKAGTNKELLSNINATEYMNGKTPLTEQSKLKDIVSAYRGSAEAMEINAIKARLVEEGMDEKTATDVSNAIFDKANDYAVSSSAKALLNSPQAQKVLNEYTKGKENPGTVDWLESAKWRQYEYAKPSSPIVQTVKEIRKFETDNLISENRKESFENLARKYGLDVNDIVEAQPKNTEDERWAVALATAYEFGSAGYGIKKLAETTGLDVNGLLTTVYNKGVEKYKNAQVQRSVRAKVDGKGTLPSQAEIDADPTHYHGGRAITESEMKSDKRLGTGIRFVSKVIAPNISRKVFFYHGDPSIGGERTADAIYINVDAEMDTDSIENGVYYDKGNIIGVFMHEFGHDIRADSSELFDELRQIVINDVYGGDVKKFDAEVYDYMASRKQSGHAVDPLGAEEEIVCDALAKIADNAEQLQRAFLGHETVGQKILDYFKRILNSLKEYISSFKQANRISAKVDVEAAEKMVDVIQKYIDQMSVETADSTTVELAEVGVAYDTESETAMLSARYIPKTDAKIKAAVTRLAKAMGVSEEEAGKWVQSELSAASLILDPKYAEALGYDDMLDRRLSAIKKNSDYPQGTLDFSNICRKRRQYTAMMQRLQKKYPNRVFTAAELAQIRQILLRNDIDVACGLCFVEDGRQREGEIADHFRRSMEAWLAGETNIDVNARQLKALEQLEKGSEIPTIYQLTTLEGMSELRKKSPAVAEAWEKFNNARGMQSARLLSRESEYKRQILDYSKKKVASINRVGGLRIYSFSDFEEFHLLDILQAVQDCAAMGIKIQAYTKVPAFAKLLMSTGAKVNRSLIPKGRLGYHMEGDKIVLDYDTREGIDINDPDFFDSSDNPDIGNVLVGINKEQISAAFLDPFVNYIIPFHTGQKAEILKIKGLEGWNNYRDYQEDKALGNRKKPINIYTEVLQAAENEGKPIQNERQFVEKFLEVCKKEQMKPRFWNFLEQDEEGNYLYRPGYYKLLLDFKMFDADGNILPQNKIIPQFDDEYINSLLTRYAEQKLENEKMLKPKLEKAYRQINNEIINRKLSTKREPAPTFYSQMGKVISQLKPGKYDSRSIVNMLLGKGVKAEEIKWSGIVPYLDGKKSVTKEDLEEFARGSMLEVEDEWLTDSNWDSNNWADYDAAESHTYTEARTIIEDMARFDELKDEKAAQRSLRVDYEDDIFYAYANIDGEERMILKYNPRERATRWAQYTLPNTRYYRELKLKMPDTDYSNQAMKVHWQESGVLAHARVDDAISNDPLIDSMTGEVYPIFFIEEIQSDWHNAGNRSGYLSAEDAHKRTEGVKDLDGLKTLIEYGIDHPSEEEFETQVNDILVNMGSTLRIENHEPGYLIYDEGLLRSSSSSQRVALRRLISILNEDAPAPEAPFKNGKYIEFVVKKLLRTAAEEGYYKIGWTTAKQQAERWSDAYAEGYRIEYDQDIPKFLNKYGKQWGAKVGQEELDNGEVVWTFPINEAMRESVVYEGQPMYSMKRIESKTTIKSGSLFSGGGLLEQGLEYALLTHDFGVEINASIAATWKENNGDGKIYAGKTEGDVNNFDGKQYKGKMFHIHASPVCHNLSPAKQGFGEQPSDIESAKKTLQIFLDAEAPVYTVENAELYAKTESARIIKEGLENAGYTVSVGVYDSADYGSPQSRKRTIIRAVRNDIQMPAEPRKIPRTRTWDQATGDMWNTLPQIQKEDIPESYLKAVAKTGIDITNVKEPTLILQTVKSGTVTYAEYGTQCPTLTTHCDEAKLLLPGGVILDTTPQFLGRLMGLPDDFKYPHFKNGKTKESVAATIIGNGIPVELTKAVIGGVIESAYEQIEEQSLYSIKRIDDTEMTAREYLAAATLETIRDPKDKAELRRIIAEYQEIDDRKPELQARIMELLEQKKEQKELVEKLKEAILRRGVTYTADVKKAVEKYGNAKAAYDAMQAELTKTENELDSTRRQQGKDTRRLREILTMPRVETIIEEQRQLVREYRQLVVATREAGNERVQAVKDKAAAELSEVKAANKERIEKLRERMGAKLQAEIDKRIEMRTRLRAEARDTRTRDYYMPRIQGKVKELEKTISKAPIPFRGPAYEFLSMLDFITRDKNGNVKKGRANISRAEWNNQINKFLGNGEESIQDFFTKYGIEVTDDIVHWIENAKAALLAQVDQYTIDVGDVALQRATPEQLAAIYQFARALNTQIKYLTKEYSETNLDVSDYTEGVSEHVGKLGKRKSSKVGALERFMRYDNAQSKTIFDRLGEWGQKLLAKLEDGADKYARNRQTISDFFKQWDQKKVREWRNPKQLIEFELEETDDEGNPVTVKFTPVQMMALYCTAKDPDGRRHLIDGDGFRLDHVKENTEGGKGTTSDTIHQFTEGDLSNLIKTMNEYDEGLIPFADSLQEFLDTVCTAWGNQVSIRRYGFEQFNVPNYFPLFTVAKDGPQSIEDILRAYSSSLYGLINRSFTTDRLPNATNALIIGDIVDIFIAHAADMALYNAYAIPVLDVARFINYKDPDEGWTIKQRLNDAFGDGVMQNYITNLLESINGQERMSITDSMFLKGLRLRNRVAVAMNARVVMQQFFSIIRSREILAGKYFKPIKDFKGTFREMMKYGPVADWKNQGNYQNDIKMPMIQEAVGAETAYGRAVDKVTEWGMKPAEAMDNLAWTMIWDACKNWVNDVQPGLEGDAFYTAVNEKFRDVIYRTQVVDSVLQKSQFMRQQTFVARMLSSFKGESTTSYNMLLRGYDRIMEAKQSGDTAAVWQAVKGPMLRSFATFAVTAIVNALVVSLADAFRDDDDYETMWEKYKEALFGEYREGAGFKSKAQSFLRSNIFESTNPFAIPWVSEIFSILQGYDPDRADLIAIEQAIDTIGNITKLFDNPTRKDVYNLLGAASQLSGFPGQNVYRDVLAMWNSTFGMVDHNLKRQITPESATSGYEALYKAMSSGQTVRALTLVDEIMDNAGDSKKAYDGVSTQIRKAYEAGKISEDEAYEYLVMATEYFDIERTEKQQRKRIAGWNKPE